jgi:AP-1-like factor
MREIEQKLAELEGKHSKLTRSYEALQVEYANVKQELEALQREHKVASPGFGIREWEGCLAERSYPLLFDVSAFCYEQEDGEQKGDRVYSG